MEPHRKPSRWPSREPARQRRRPRERLGHPRPRSRRSNGLQSPKQAAARLLLFVADRSINVEQAKRAAELALLRAKRRGGDASSIRAAAQKVQDLGGNGDASTSGRRRHAISRQVAPRPRPTLHGQRTARTNQPQKPPTPTSRRATSSEGTSRRPSRLLVEQGPLPGRVPVIKWRACVMVAVTAAAHGAWSNVASYCAKAEHALDAPGVAKKQQHDPSETKIKDV